MASATEDQTLQQNNNSANHVDKTCYTDNQYSKTTGMVGSTQGAGNATRANVSPPSDGILISKDEIFLKNRTFHYSKESSTTRGENLVIENRRKRSSQNNGVSSTNVSNNNTQN